MFCGLWLFSSFLSEKVWKKPEFVAQVLKETLLVFFYEKPYWLKKFGSFSQFSVNHARYILQIKEFLTFLKNKNFTGAQIMKERKNEMVKGTHCIGKKNEKAGWHQLGLTSHILFEL